MAQPVKHLIPDLSSGLELRIMSLSPTLGSSAETTLKKKKKKRGYLKDGGEGCLGGSVG